LVLTSLHTPNASASLGRLRNMGIAPYDLEESLRAVIAQRLVRMRTHEGLKGRTGIFECYQSNTPYQSLQEVADCKVATGITTFDEIRRVL